MGAEIAAVLPLSLAEELGLLAGERILKINGKPLRDLIQFQYEWAGEEVLLEIEKTSGEVLLLEVEKEYDEPLGVVFDSAVFDRIKPCGNKCLFCFVDQMPPRLRPSLYVKDDDYRLSFLQGSYITMTNLTSQDIKRIKRERLSPLFVSVHTTDSCLRASMMGNTRAGEILTILYELSQAGIEFHTQVVLCPGINDGPYLEQTYRDLMAIDGVLSLAIVPVGLTKFRANLPALDGFTPGQARDLLGWARVRQEENRHSRGSAFIWLSDEFYLLAGEDLPSYEEYEDFVQLENGVGMVRLLWHDFSELSLPGKVNPPRKAVLVTGQSGQYAMLPLVDRLNTIEGLQVEIKVLENSFFGPSVTVAGLLTGSCLLAGLQDLPEGSRVLLPQVMLKSYEDRFLDDLTLEEVAKGLKVDLVPVRIEAQDLVDKLFSSHE